MFKKRANNKKIDLNQQLSEIPVVSQIQPNQVQDSSPQASKLEEVNLGPQPSSRQKIKANFITLQALQKTQTAETKPLERQFPQLKKEEMNDYLNEIRNFKPLETAEQENQQMNIRTNTMVIVEQQNGYNSQDYDDNEMIEVEEDFQGGFSPSRQQGNDYHEDYEDQLIKRTLTKQNYEQLRLRGGPILSDLKAVQNRDKLLQKVEKVSARKIENTIKRDLEQKRKKHEQIQQQIRMKKYSAQRQKNEILKKEKRLNDLKKDLQNVNKVIEYLYFYGDKVSVFEKEAILKQIEGQGRTSMLYNFDDVE